MASSEDSPNSAQLIQCKYCFKVLKHKYILNRHVKVVHEGFRPYVCDCGKSFATREQLSRHTNSKHTNQKPYLCEKGCDKSFASYTAREYHHRSAHEGVKYVCIVCKRQYSAKNQLKNHYLRLHFFPWMAQNYLNFFNS